jgi:EAL domain-containing protein (putative c-di-GMP-specific phosphodiesterase class I)
MYRAKRSGSDRVEIFNPEMRSEPGGRVALEEELRGAIEKKQLRLVYQPIFYLPTETLAGFEAQLRWEHPRLGTLDPAHFVPVAEESDLILKLGSYVLTRAAREAQRWQRELPRPDQPLFVSVNVSSRQLFRPDLINEVRHILGRAVMPKGSLRLEISESLVMENPERALAVLEQLRAAGAGLALDEFATGYSSLSYLGQFAFDSIKVDGAFVQGRGQNGNGGAMLRSIVALAKELGRKVVAEGVGAEDDIVFLRSIGCEYAQGVYYGELMSERDVLQLLKVVRRAERRMKEDLLCASGRTRGGRCRRRCRPVPAARKRPSRFPGIAPPHPSPRCRQRAPPPAPAAPAQAAPPPPAGPPGLPQPMRADRRASGPCRRRTPRPTAAACADAAATPLRPARPLRQPPAGGDGAAPGCCPPCRAALPAAPPPFAAPPPRRVLPPPLPGAPAGRPAAPQPARTNGRPARSQAAAAIARVWALAGRTPEAQARGPPNRWRRPDGRQAARRRCGHPGRRGSTPSAATRVGDADRAAQAAGLVAGTTVDADLGQGPLVLVVEVAIEQEIEVRRAMQPAVGLDLVLELPRPPAGVSKRQDRPVRARPAGDCPQDLHRGRERDVIVDRQRRIGGEIVRAVQHEAEPRVHRPADLNVHVDQARALDRAALGLCPDAEFLQQLRKADMRRPLVDDQAHGPLRGVRAHVDDRAREAAVAHAGHGDQELAVEIAAVLALAAFASRHHVEKTSATGRGLEGGTARIA